MKTNFSLYKKFFSLTGKPRKLVNVLLIESYLVLLLFFIVIGYFWIFQQYKSYKKESQKIQQNYIESQKSLIRKETLAAIDFINYRRLQTDNALKELLRARTNEAISIAYHIHDKFKYTKSQEEIKSLIIEALRPIKFNNGRGYFFIGTISGISLLYPVEQTNEGKNLYNMQDDMGNFVIQEEITMARSYGEGFCYGYWKKPGFESSPSQKISFVMLFKPFNWVLGCGEYIDEYTRDVQKDVLDRISKIRYGKEGYIFINTYDGDALITDGNIVNIPKNLWELEDPNGVKVIQEERNAVKNPEGDFIYYSWRKLTSTEIGNKISFVKGIPEWQWMVGAGVYTDEIEQTLVEYKNNLIKSIRKNILVIIIILISVLALLTVLSIYISRKASNNIESFIRFFKKASYDYITIDENKIYFSEFKSLASSANNMIREMKKHNFLSLRKKYILKVCLKVHPKQLF